MRNFFSPTSARSTRTVDDVVRLLASLADSGQQTPVVVVAAEGQADRYVVIDGYKRIAALEQLGRDTVEAVVWPMSEAAAVLLDRSLRLSEHETALEVGWLLADLRALENVSERNVWLPTCDTELLLNASFELRTSGPRMLSSKWIQYWILGPQM